MGKRNTQKSQKLGSGGLQGLRLKSARLLTAQLFFSIPQRRKQKLSQQRASDRRITGSLDILSSSGTRYIIGWQMKYFSSQCLEHLTPYISGRCQMTVPRLQTPPLARAWNQSISGLLWHYSG